MFKAIAKLPGWRGMNKFLARLTIYGCLTVLGCCITSQVIHKWPFYRGSSVLWDWGSDLQSDDPAKRTHAAEVLSAALSDESLTVRRKAALAFFMFGRKYPSETKVAIPALLRALEDDDESVRSGAKRTLKEIDPDAARKAGIGDD